MKTHYRHRDPSYIHHRSGRITDNIREVVFGVQDGMVSTLVVGYTVGVLST